MGSYRLNPSIIVMQRRLFAPQYEGPGKWVLYDAASKRSFLAIQSQQDLVTGALPAVLRLLTRRLDDAMDEAACDQLVKAGLLEPLGADRALPDTLLDLFHMSVFDYPFLDYSTSQAFEEDSQRMERYAHGSPMPHTWTDRRGSEIELPAVTWEDLEAASHGGPFGLSQLAAVLRFTFGPVGVLGTGSGSHIRKTSPSGGAKHPTEGWVELAAPWEGLGAGSYVYEGQTHRLVAAPDPYEAEPPLEDAVISISIRSRVERAMWRYRDARSSRAVLLDAGHVIETLTTLLRMYGADPAVCPQRRPPRCSPQWLREPEVARVVLAGPPRYAVEPVRSGSAFDAQPTPDGSVSTNPAMYFTLGEGGFTAHVLYPDTLHARVDITDFELLTHCIRSHRGEPSRSGDRYTTVAAVREKFGSESKERLTRLTACGALVQREQAAELYGEVRRWAEVGWYMPLLTWLEAMQMVEGGGAREIKTALPHSAPFGVPEMNEQGTRALRQRVTTRSFSPRPLGAAHVLELLQAAASTPAKEIQTEIYAACLNVDGTEEGTLGSYEPAAGSLLPLGRSLSPSNLAEITIGQQWVSRSAAAVWLVAIARHPSEFLPSQLWLGRAAQRLTLRATGDGVGVFQTPAVRDVMWCDALGLAPDPGRIIYAVYLGWPSVPRGVATEG